MQEGMQEKIRDCVLCTNSWLKISQLDHYSLAQGKGVILLSHGANIHSTSRKLIQKVQGNLFWYKVYYYDNSARESDIPPTSSAISPYKPSWKNHHTGINYHKFDFEDALQLLLHK